MVEITLPGKLVVPGPPITGHRNYWKVDGYLTVATLVAQLNFLKIQGYKILRVGYNATDKYWCFYHKV